MPWVGFEPMVPASEQAKTVHALDRSGIGNFKSYSTTGLDAKF
jgi:hypothetical protein